MDNADLRPEDILEACSGERLRRDAIEAVQAAFAIRRA
jgi:hypothetical protein